MFVDDNIVIFTNGKNNEKIIINVVTNNISLPFESSTFDFRFPILNIFS